MDYLISVLMGPFSLIPLVSMALTATAFVGMLGREVMGMSIRVHVATTVILAWLSLTLIAALAASHDLPRGSDSGLTARPSAAGGSR